MLALSDPPRHRSVRTIMTRAFTPTLMSRLRITADRVSGEVLARALEQRDCEFVNDVAARLPIALTCELMGIPESDWELMYRLTRTAFGADDPSYQTSASARMSATRAHTEIMLYYRELLNERGTRPREDLVSAIARGVVDDARLSIDELSLHCDNLHVAGQETARHAIVGGVLAFIDSPEQWRVLRQAESTVRPAVEEILRWTSPALHVLRTARADVQLDESMIRAGDAVTIWNASANRDEDVFPAPDRFEIERSPNRHLALGAGEHHCLGAALTRMELHAMFRVFRFLVRNAAVAGPVVRLRSNLVGGYTSVPLTLDPW